MRSTWWMKVSECLVGYDLPGLADRGDRTFRIDRLPEHDGGNYEGSDHWHDAVGFRACGPLVRRAG
jgi:hypothetical protein